jgi:thioredoxin reductase
MPTETTEQVELVIIGGGPAGMSAALEARRAGVSVVLLEERPTLGGQIYKRFGSGFSVTDGRRVGHEHRDGGSMIKAVQRSGTDVRTSTVVWGIWGKTIAFQSEEQASGTIEAGEIIVAAGARDRPMAFPGWTLPGVITAGAAKSLVATQLVLPGRRILMAGSGPLALAFSAQLHAYGANIVEVNEAAPAPGARTLARMIANADPALLVEAARYRGHLLRHRIPFHYSSIIVRAEGETEVERAVVADVDRDWRVVPDTERSIDVDTILLGYGLESSIELTRLLGCDHHYESGLGGWVPVRDEWMRTSVPGVLVAGDGGGVAGSPTAILEGRLAGIAAAVNLGWLTTAEAGERAGKGHRRLRRMERFVAAMAQLYPVGPGIHELATDETVVCRCEEISAATIDNSIDTGAKDPGVIRALTRAGMGRCQGRNCGSHIAAAVARRTGRAIDTVELPTVRPPVKPVTIAAIASEREQGKVTADLD